MMTHVVQKVATIFVAIFVLSVTAYYEGEITKDGLIYVGTVEGKSYFADIGPERNWTAAKSFCNETSMHLASITSKAQNDFLANSSIINSSRYGLWTSGKDAQTLQQFAWESNGEPLNDTVINFIGNWPIYICVYYYRGNCRSNLCTANQYTLCEVVHA